MSDRPVASRSTTERRTPRIPADHDEAMVELDGRRVRLTNLRKVLWPRAGVTKGALIQYYLDVAWAVLPHLADRPMVMKRYPNGVGGKYFVMKRAPTPRPKWVRTCVTGATPSDDELAVVDDTASLAWAVNLGCIELLPWMSPVDDVERPDAMVFDVDPGDAPFELAREAALILHAALDQLRMNNYVKTSGEQGLHVLVPLERGPLHEETWDFARVLAREIAEAHPKIITAAGPSQNRPAGRVSLGYAANVRGHVLPAPYSVRVGPRAMVSTPLTWDEIARGASASQFRIEDVPVRLRRVGDLWAPLAPAARGRATLPPPECPA